MRSDWTRHAKTQKATLEARQLVQNSGAVFDLLTNILTLELNNLDNSKIEDYSKPHWPCYQADQNGYKRAIKNVLDLINLREK